MIVLLTDITGREHRIGVADTRFVPPEESDGPIVDHRGLVAMSGLADCHAHLSGDTVDDMIEYDGADLDAKMRRNAIVQMENGVLLLADKGARSSLTLRFLQEDEATRPRLEMAGRMVAVAEGYYPGFCAEVDSGNLRSVIGGAVSGGASWVKLVGDWPRRGRGPVSNFTEDQLAEIVAIAHDAGCRVAIHTTAPETPGMAVRAGVDSIEHGLYLEEADIALLGARGGAWVPTVLAMESTASWLGSESSGGRMFFAGLSNVRDRLVDAVDAGVVVLAGTDLAIPHGAVAQEAARLVDYGLSAPQAIDAVGDAAFRYTGMQSGFVPGAPADLVLFDGDPVADITALQRPAHVMRAGRVVASRLS